MGFSVIFVFVGICTILFLFLFCLGVFDDVPHFRRRDDLIIGAEAKYFMQEICHICSSVGRKIAFIDLQELVVPQRFDQRITAVFMLCLVFK